MQINLFYSLINLSNEILKSCNCTFYKSSSAVPILAKFFEENKSLQSEAHFLAFHTIFSLPKEEKSMMS